MNRGQGPVRNQLHCGQSAAGLRPRRNQLTAHDNAARRYDLFDHFVVRNRHHAAATSESFEAVSREVK